MIFHFVNSSLLFQGPHRGAGELRRVFFRLSFLLPFSIFFFNTLHFPHSSISTLRIFYTPRFPHFAFSTFRVFHTPHSAFSTEPSPNDNFRSRKSDSKFFPIDPKQDFRGAKYVKVKLSVWNLSIFCVVSTNETKMFQTELFFKGSEFSGGTRIIFLQRDFHMLNILVLKFFPIKPTFSEHLLRVRR